MDLFSNSAYRFFQYDGTASLPLHGKNGYHLPGDVTLAENGTFVRLIELLKPIFDSVNKRKKIIIPPLPRYIIAGCCSNIEHCTNRCNPDFVEKVTSDLSRVYGCLKKELRTAGIRDFWVMDWDMVLESPRTESISELTEALKRVCAADGVHFNPLGRGNMAQAIGRAVVSANEGTLVPSQVATPKKFFWRGFVSCEGSKTHSETKRFTSNMGRGNLKFHPYARK